MQFCKFLCLSSFWIDKISCPLTNFGSQDFPSRPGSKPDMSKGVNRSENLRRRFIQFAQPSRLLEGGTGNRHDPEIFPRRETAFFSTLHLIFFRHVTYRAWNANNSYQKEKERNIDFSILNYHRSHFIFNLYALFDNSIIIKLILKHS